MKKTITGIVCLLLCLLTLTGCTFSFPWQGESVSSVLDVSGASVGSDLFAYYLTLVLRNPEKYGLADAKDSKATEVACALCTEYVAVNSAFRGMKLTLKPEYKMQIAENVSTKWSFYKKYYKEVGIRKQTITKYETNEAKRKTLLEHMYGVGGTQAVSEIELNAYYGVNYVTFQTINGYLTRVNGDGKTEKLSATEITAAENRFKQMCDDVHTGTSMEDVCKKNANDPYVASSEVDTFTINRKNSSYPTEFFNSVQRMQEGEAKVIETQDYIFLVVKQSDDSDTDYEAHKLACLQEMFADQFRTYLTSITSGYKIKKDSAAIKSTASAVRARFK